MLPFIFTLLAFTVSLLLTARLSSKLTAPIRTGAHKEEADEPTPARTYTITYPDGTEVTVHV